MKKLLCVFFCLLLTGCSSFQPTSSYDNAEVYLNYLEKAHGDEELIEGYINKVDGGYRINFYNGNEDVFCLGKVRLLNEADKKICTYTTGLFGPNEFSYSTETLEEEPTRFIFEKTQFYQFTYPDANVNYSVVYDYNDELEWNNLLLDEAWSMDDVIAASKYQYAYNVVTESYCSLYYFYDENRSTYYDEEYDGDYPDVSSAIYGTYFDYNEKIIELYESKGDIWEKIENLQME